MRDWTMKRLRGKRTGAKKAENRRIIARGAAQKSGLKGARVAGHTDIKGLARLAC
jgi:hypothetical protein